MRRAHVVFAYRSPAAGAQAKLPACRAFRISPRPAEEFSATNPAVAAGVLTPSPALSGVYSGRFPVYVQLTSEGGGDHGPLLPVYDDGWVPAPTGRNWRIAYVHAPQFTGNPSRFAFVVETVDSLDECGQVNAPQRPELLFHELGGEAAIETPVLDLSGVTHMLFVVQNTGGPVARDLFETMYRDDGLTAIRGPSLLRTVAGASEELGAYGPGAVVTGNTWAVARIPPSRAKYRLAGPAVGTVGALAIFVRRS